MYEIELKAWVDDVSATENKINEFAKYIGLTEKHDTYWRLKESENGIRIRQETGKPITATWKQKNLLQSEIELNTEREFIIGSTDFVNDTIPNEKNAEALKNSLANFEDFLKLSGFEIHLQKYKSTKTWQHKTEEFDLITIEISYVETLGYFIEIEILSEKNDDKTVTKAQNCLHETLQKCEISKEKIETRYYWQLLKETL
ncbi:MAG: CYTH domain-containing protein [Spirochaetaceae bacterium]|nr:CYTH domain-containing protein [Spirochaetaceae bacterium]